MHSEVFGPTCLSASSLYSLKQRLCVTSLHVCMCSCAPKKRRKKSTKKPVFSSSLYSSVYPNILYYSLRWKANLFSNCSSRQRKVQASFGQPISQKPVSTSFSRWSTLNICFYECSECNPKAAVPVTESYHCLENVNVFLKVLEAILTSVQSQTDFFLNAHVENNVAFVPWYTVPTLGQRNYFALPGWAASQLHTLSK